MSLTSATYGAIGEQEPGFLQEVGAQAISGALMQSLGLARGRDYIKHSAGGVFGGGWQNRFAVAAQSNLMQLAGLDLTSVGTTARDAAFSKRNPYSLFGWQSVRGGYHSQYRASVDSLRGLSPEAARIGRQAAATKLAGAPKTFLQAVKKHPVRMGFQSLGNILGVVSVVSGAYKGYQESGLSGAAVGGARAAGIWAMYGIGEAAVSSVLKVSAAKLALPVAAVAAAGYGAYKALEAGAEHMRDLRQLDMGAPMFDPHGLGYTMRQRSLMELQRSQINGRFMHGNEAVIMSGPMRLF